MFLVIVLIIRFNDKMNCTPRCQNLNLCCFWRHVHKRKRVSLPTNAAGADSRKRKHEGSVSDTTEFLSVKKEKYEVVDCNTLTGKKVWR